MYVVLLTAWTNLPHLGGSEESYDVIEFFAGVSRISRLAASTGLRAARVDMVFDKGFTAKPTRKTNKSRKKSCMDLNTPGGFWPLGCKSERGRFDVRQSWGAKNEVPFWFPCQTSLSNKHRPLPHAFAVACHADVAKCCLGADSGGQV